MWYRYSQTPSNVRRDPFSPLPGQPINHSQLDFQKQWMLQHPSQDIFNPQNKLHNMVNSFIPYLYSPQFNGMNWESRVSTIIRGLQNGTNGSLENQTFLQQLEQELMKLSSNFNNGANIGDQT
jgi:hypothetical protein